jgi:hypothetical protein
MPPRRVALGGLALFGACCLLPGGGYAQSPPAGDPPARVGRVAMLRGAVALHAADTDAWSPALLNYPVTSGTAVQVPADGHAEVQVDVDRFAVSGGGELDITRLDDSTFAATLPQGEVCFTLATVPPGRSYGVQTPRGLVQIATGGRYAVVTGDTEHPTVVSVIEGAAAVSATGMQLQLTAGQAASITGPGADQASGTVLAAAPDECLTGLLAEERPPARLAAAAPPVVVQMTGGEELAGYGAWQPAPGYSSVWFPQVATDWAPYRRGRWVDVAPWGWTWCDDEPWGFAPFHYGRWARFHDRWGWVPGEAASRPPIYAPALVAFFGVGGVGIAVGAAGPGNPGRGDIGWVPLAPHDPYYPWYHGSPSYVRDINQRHVADVTEVVNNYTHNTYSSVVVSRYTNAAAATVVPAAALAASQPVAPLARPVAVAQLAAARPVIGEHAASGSPAAAAFRLPAPALATPGRAGSAPSAATPGAVRPGEVPRLPPAGAAGARHPATTPLSPAGGVSEPRPTQAVQPPVAHPEVSHAAETARPPATAPGTPRPAELVRPAAAPPEAAHPAEIARPAAPPPNPPRPAPITQPSVAQPSLARPEAAHPAEVARPAQPLPSHAAEAAHPPAPRTEEAHPTPLARPPAAKPEPPHEAAVARPPVAHAPQPVIQAAEPHPEAARPAPSHPQEDKRKLPEQP